MGNCSPFNMAKIEPPSLSARIDAIEVPVERRPHLGGSILGHSCQRYLWYNFRWAYKGGINTRLNRIFRLGDAIEDLIIADLARAGMTVTNGQVRVIGYKGHGGGSIDGMIGDTLFEAKSMNVSNYNKVRKQGVRTGFPTYYSQMQYYMGSLELDTGLFVSMNKNTQELYTEVVEFNPEEYERLQEIERNVIDATNADHFERVGYNASWHECRFCDASDVCHQDLPLEVSCRTCTHVIVCADGRWYCDLKKEHRDMRQQLEACTKYKG